MTADAEYLATLRAVRAGTARVVTPTVGPSPTKYSTPTPIPNLPEGTPLSNLTPPAPLSAKGPVLLFSTATPTSPGSPLWAVNADGTGFQTLLDENFEAFAVSPTSSMANGIAVAYVTREGESPDFEYTLKVVRLPNGSPQTITSLTGKDAEIANFEMALQLKWSHDGRRLAFVGGIEGETADVYMYSLDSGNITRLSEGPKLLAWNLQWSPDDQYIKYEAFDFIPEHGCCGDVWVVPSDGTRQGVSIGYVENYKDWVDGHTIFAEQAGLNLINVGTGEIERIYEGKSHVAFDPEDKIWLVAPHIESCSSTQEWLLIQANGDKKSLPINGCDDGGIWLDNAGVFQNQHRGGQLILISPDGHTSESHVPVADFSVPAVSDNGQYWAWTNPCCVFDSSGLWVSTGDSNFRRIVLSKYYVWDVAWVPGEDTMFFLAGGSLYMASAPEFEPILVSPPDLYLDEFLIGPTWIP